MHARIHAHTHTQSHTHTCAHTHTHTHTRTRTHAHTHIGKSTCIHTRRPLACKSSVRTLFRSAGVNVAPGLHVLPRACVPPPPQPIGPNGARPLRPNTEYQVTATGEIVVHEVGGRVCLFVCGCVCVRSNIHALDARVCVV